MKKNKFYIVLLVFVLIAIPILTVIDSNSKPDFSKIEKDDNWEFVKDRVTTGYVAMNITKFKGPILYELHNATKQDSIAVKEVVEELKAVLPNKSIENYSVFNEGKSVKSTRVDERLYYDRDNHVIRFYFGTINTQDDGQVTVVNNNILGVSTDNRNLRGVLNPKIYFMFEPNISFDKRKQYIQYEFFRKLTIPKGSSFNNLSTENEEIKNSIFATREFKPENSKFSDYDRFFLQKVYSGNLAEELENYLYATYPWRYSTYLINRNKAEFVALLLSVTLSIIMIFTGLGLLYLKKYKYTFFSYLLPMLVVFLSWNCLNNIYFYITYYGISTIIEEYLVNFFLSLIVIVILTFILYLLDKIFIRKDMPFVIQLIFKVSFVILVGSIFIYVFHLLQSPKNFGVEIYSYQIYVKLVVFLAVGRGILIYLSHFSESLIKQKDVELSRLKEVNAQAEVKLLQSQINPHFLYNALNSIASLAHKNADKTEQMALSLSDLFKYSINKKGQKMSTIADEVEMVQNYLDIEQIRFGDRLQFSIQVDEDVESVKIPMFIIQPLVENAVKHGISKIESEGLIALKIKNTDLDLSIIVEDNGPHFPEGIVSGHGLQTVFDLLRLTYGEKASLSWENTPIKHIKITIEKVEL